MLSIISLISVTLGASAAVFADGTAAHKDILEIGAGVLLIGGFLLLGSSLPAML